MINVMISVVIPLYNKEKSVKATLEKVLEQSFQDFEVIVVNDGSSDGGPEVVNRVNDSRIRLLNQENAGVSAARNRGIAEARGEYIAFLDADDEWDEDYLLTQNMMAKKYPECAVFGTNYRFKNHTGAFSPTILNHIQFEGTDGIVDNYFQIASCSHPPLWTSAVMVRKEALEAIGGFPVGIKSGEDLLTWARLAARYKIAYWRKPLAVFNVEGYNRNERPKRIPAEVDEVGKGLQDIKIQFNPPHIDGYIAMWLKMRSVIYMRLNMTSKGFREAGKAISYNPTNPKLWALALMNLIPSIIRNRLMR